MLRRVEFGLAIGAVDRDPSEFRINNPNLLDSSLEQNLDTFHNILMCIRSRQDFYGN